MTQAENCQTYESITNVSGPEKRNSLIKGNFAAWKMQFVADVIILQRHEFHIGLWKVRFGWSRNRSHPNHDLT